MKNLLLLLLLSSNAVFASTITCTDKDNTQRAVITSNLSIESVALNGQNFECTESSISECTSINFETTEVLKIILSDDKKSANLELMPAPGSGFIKAYSLQCE